MGICTGKEKEREKIVSTKAVFQTDSFGKIQFYFTTENLLRIDADCLVLYCDEKMNLSKNTFVANIGKFESRKIKEFAEAHLLTSKARIVPGQVVLFPICISTLQFKFIAMICLKPWNSHENMENNLSSVMANLFNELNRHHIQTLALTEYNEHFGIPVQTGCKSMIQPLYENQEWLKIVTIICNNISTQQFYM